MGCDIATERRYRVPRLTFKGWMAENHIRQNEIADILGLSLQSINLKVNGKQDFTLAQIAKICEHYHISADLFLPYELRYSNKEEL